MTTVQPVLAAIALVAAAAAAASAQSLEPQWSRPVGGKTRFVGVEEYGRCSVFVDNGVIQVVSASGEVSWTWPFAKISKYIHPEKAAVSSDCDAIAFVGDASYKYVWVVHRGGTSVSIQFVGTPADVAFDRTGTTVAIGTYANSLFLYSTVGQLQWRRDTEVAIVNDIEFTDDNRRIVFRGWAGIGVVTVAGHVEWNAFASRLRASRDLSTFAISDEPSHGPGDPVFTITDGQRKTLWSHIGTSDVYLSSSGERVLASVDRPGIFTRTGERVITFADYSWPIAISEDGTRVWLRADDHIACVDDGGNVLARIDGEVSYGGVNVSRDFAQLLIRRERDLHGVSVERYEVPKPCRP